MEKRNWKAMASNDRITARAACVVFDKRRAYLTLEVEPQLQAVQPAQIGLRGKGPSFQAAMQTVKSNRLLFHFVCLFLKYTNRQVVVDRDDRDDRQKWIFQTRTIQCNQSRSMLGRARKAPRDDAITSFRALLECSRANPYIAPVFISLGHHHVEQLQSLRNLLQICFSMTEFSAIRPKTFFAAVALMKSCPRSDYA